MIILIIRTDNPEAEIGLYDDSKKIKYKKWQAHRLLGETIHDEIKLLLGDKDWSYIEAIVFYKGPGSFTGLRIGLSVANALASSLKIPIVSAMGEKWIENGISRLMDGENEICALPEYGSSVYTTVPKK